MPDNPGLHDLIRRIVAIDAPAQNTFGGGIPGNVGMSGSANQAAASGGEETVEHLKRAALELERLAIAQAPADKLAGQADDVEGLLLMTTTLSVLRDEQAGQLLDQLRDLYPRQGPDL